MFDETQYLNLLNSIVPKPIESEEELNRFTQIAESLGSREDITVEGKAILELLILLITDYEDKHYPIEEPQPLEYLLHLIEVRGLKQRDLVGILGAKGVVSEVINSKREITKSQAKALGRFFNVSYKSFLI